MTDIRIAGLVGSLRQRSVNAAIARAAFAQAPEGVTMVPFDLAGLPLYNGDIEDAGVPDSVVALHEAAEEADGLMFFSPEYNSSFPAVTKNAIDWLSRPPRSFEGRAVSLVTATPGSRAGLGIRNHFESSLAHLPVRLFASLGIGSYFDKMDDGELTDEETLAVLAAHVGAFAEFSRANIV